MANGAIFGWVLAGTIECPIMHHVGIILEWNEDDPLSSIIAHYGIENKGVVHLETLGEAAMRSNVDVVHINPHHCLENACALFMRSEALLVYVEEHPAYNLWTCNCQHFVRHFIPGIILESDIRNELASGIRSCMMKSLFHKDGIGLAINNLMRLYQDRRSSVNGICRWDRRLDVVVGCIQ